MSDTRKIEAALLAFEHLKKKEVFTIAKVKVWLIQYIGNYQELKSNWNCPIKSCSFQKTRLCDCKEKCTEYSFYVLFETLLNFSKYHQKEEYARLELELYETIKHDNDLLKKWVIKNEYIGTKECFELLLCHYDYDLNPYHLLVVGKQLLGYEVFIDRADFKNLMTFMEVFNDLFWIKKIGS